MANEALAALVHDPTPCVVVLDLMIPNLDGWGVVKRLAFRKELATLPVVITSAAADEAPSGVAHVRPEPVDVKRVLANRRYVLQLSFARAGKTKPEPAAGAVKFLSLLREQVENARQHVGIRIPRRR